MIDKILLFPYWLSLKIRHFLYDAGLKKVRSADVPTICIGNITVGGTGKTPHTEMLIRTLLQDQEWGGKNLAVLSRGYKRKTKGFQQVTADGSAAAYGDEPLQIKKKFPGITVAVDGNRIEGCDFLAHPEKLQSSKKARKCMDKNLPASDLIILDDAFQHRSLKPTLSIVLVDYNRPIFKDHLLPFGRLRDLPQRIAAADIVIVSKCPNEVNAWEKCTWAENLGIMNFDATSCSGTRRNGKKQHIFLDLWQHPLAVARYHGVKPWSDDHYSLLRPLLKELASIGQKTITTTLTDHPWNHQNFDAYYTMVEHVKVAGGKFTHDYRIFDEWVEFAQSCGLGPQIHCYTMVTWGNIVHYVDGATGDKVAVKLVPGTPEHEEFWGPFLVDFEKHLKAKGWLGRTYIAIDERSREELMHSAAVLNKYAPSIKIQMAGNKPPSTFKGIEIQNYSQSMRASWVSPEFKAEVKTRREKGYVTTTYICCSPPRPNTFTFSQYSEQQWLALYTAAQGFDGMLRWAVFNWPRDPFFDTAFNPHFGSWAPGDTFLVYPGPRLSVRWENLRDSIENFEKIRMLRESGESTPELEKALSGIDYTKEAANGDETYFAGRVKAVTDAIAAASAK